MINVGVQRGMVDERRLSVLLSLLFVAGAVPVALAERSFGLLAVLLFAAVAGPLWIDRHGVTLLPPWAVRVAVVGAAAWACCEYVVLGAYPEIVIGRFMIWVSVCKLLDRKGTRDYGQLLVLVLLLVVVCSRVSATVLFPATLAVYLTLGTYVAILFHLKCEADRWVTDGTPSFRSGGPGLPRGGLAGPTTVIAIGSIVAAVVSFLFLPRLGVGTLGRTHHRRTSRVTGFGEEVEFGQLATRIRSSNALVMRVEMRRGGLPYGGPDFQPYLRGQTLECYERRPGGKAWRWRHENGNAPPLPQPWLPDGSTVRLLGRETSNDPYDWIVQEVTLVRAAPTQPLFAVYPPGRVVTHGFKQVDRERRTLLLYGTPRRNRAPHYVVYSPTHITEALAKKLAKPGAFFRPPVSPRVEQYTRALLARAGADRTDPAAVAEVIAEHLRSDRFTYTLDQTGVDPTVEPVEDFLFARHRGHCEYFSSSMVVMCQLMGLSARVVNGYHGGEYNTVGAFYEVRESDAHSWVEVYVPGRDWVRYEPTPGGTKAASRAGGWWASLGAYVGYWQFKWASLVVSYDADHRMQVLERLEAWLTGPAAGPGGTMTDWVRAAAGRVASVWKWATASAPRFAAAALGLVVLIWAALVVQLRFRRVLARLRPRGLGRTRGRTPRHPDGGFYEEFVGIARRLGCTPHAHQTPREFADAVARRIGGGVPVRPVADALYQLEYGGRPLSTPQRRTIGELLSHLRALHPPRSPR